MLFILLLINANPLKTGYQHAVNSARIWWGLFTTDSNKSFWGRAWELFSRFTFQAVQTNLGFIYAHCSNKYGNIQNVGHLYGATVITTGSMHTGRAVTIGNYITGGRNLEASVENGTFQHEYGHYIQSQRLGFAYLPVVGIPSIINAGKANSNHRFQPYEMNANYLAFMYFNKHNPLFYSTRNEYYLYLKGINGDYKGWYFGSHPLTSDGGYVDYHDSEQMNEVRNSTSLKIHFWNYIIPFIPNF